MPQYGDTGDNPRYTICSNYIFQYYTNIMNNNALRHGGHLNMNFADGHAKAVSYKIGLWPAVNGTSPMGLPKSQTDQAKYCANPDATTTALGPAMTCTQIMAYINSQTTWYPD